MFSYPDVVVVCGEPRFHDHYRDVLVNPVVLIAVISPTPEAFDRGDKFFRYRTWLQSLTDYILVRAGDTAPGPLSSPTARLLGVILQRPGQQSVYRLDCLYPTPGRRL